MTAPADNQKPAAGQAQADAAASKAALGATAAEQEAARAKAEAEKAAQAQKEAEEKAKAEAEAAKAAAKSAGSTTTLKQVRALIMRDEQTQVPAYVFEHEMPILRALHGDDRVSVIETDSVEVAGFNPASELERLKRKYKNRDTADIVALVYRNDPELLASKAGVKYSGAGAAKPARSTVTKGKKRVIGAKK